MLQIHSGESKMKKCSLSGRAAVFSHKKGEYWEKVQVTSHLWITQPLQEEKSTEMTEGGACRTSRSLFRLEKLAQWASSGHSSRPFVKRRWKSRNETEKTLEREHLSQGNERKAGAKQHCTDWELRRWTVFSICTHLHEKRQRSGHQFH